VLRFKEEGWVGERQISYFNHSFIHDPFIHCIEQPQPWFVSLVMGVPLLTAPTPDAGTDPFFLK